MNLHAPSCRSTPERHRQLPSGERTGTTLPELLVVIVIAAIVMGMILGVMWQVFKIVRAWQ